MNLISSKLIEMGIEPSKPIVPIANYVQTKIVDSVILVSGQLPFKNGEILYKGVVGKDITIDEAKIAAELCVINIVNQIINTVDDNFDKIKSCVKLEIFISCGADFERHAEIANAASDFVIKIFGERGRHTRVTIGVCSLPLNSSIEIAAIFETHKTIE